MTLEGLFQRPEMQAFLHEGWGNQCIHLREQALEQGSMDFDKVGFFRAAMNPTLKYPYIIVYSVDGSKGGFEFVSHLEYGQTVKARPRALKPDIGKLRGLLDGGANVSIRNIDRLVPQFYDLASSAQSYFGCRVTVDAFHRTMPGPGSPRQYDNDHVLVFQVEGSSSWRLGREPAVRWPHRRYAPKVESSAMEESDEVLLQAGAMLYIPPGSMYEMMTTGPSLYIAMKIHTPQVIDVLRKYLQDACSEIPSLRREFFPDRSRFQQLDGDALQALKDELMEEAISDTRRHLARELEQA